MNAHQVAAGVRSGRSGAARAVATALEHLHTGQAELNACIDIHDDAAERAAVLDRRVAEGGDPGPLAGVPIAVKDIIDQAGRTTTCGSGFYRSTPASSAAVIDRLEAAGAIIVARTNLEEFAFGFASENDWFGPVHNPWDTTTSAGGSSGGSAAVVAARQVPVALGTDTGGSVRVPAALCGVFGLKPTHGAVPLTGVFPLAAPLDTVGPIATTIGDLATCFAAMAGHDPRDPWSRPDAGEVRQVDGVAGLRVAVPTTWIKQGPVDDGILTAFEAALDHMTTLGMRVERIEAPWLVPDSRMNALSYPHIARVHRAWWEAGRPYGKRVASRLEEAFAVTFDQHLDAHAWRAHIARGTDALWASHDVIVTPTTGITTKRLGVDTAMVNGVEVHHRAPLSWFTALVNHLGLPALAAPLATGATGVPPSLQIIGPPSSEGLLLTVGEHLVAGGALSSPSPARMR